uniref:Uncharacterized protein n=1 Tax=Cucumis melo TaxID=3656 RepID=A0A9I9DZN9_CUCME
MAMRLAEQAGLCSRPQPCVMERSWGGLGVWKPPMCEYLWWNICRLWGNIYGAQTGIVWSLVERGLTQWWRMGKACDWKKLGRGRRYFRGYGER